MMCFSYVFQWFLAWYVARLSSTAWGISVEPRAGAGSKPHRGAAKFFEKVTKDSIVYGDPMYVLYD